MTDPNNDNSHNKPADRAGSPDNTPVDDNDTRTQETDDPTWAEDTGVSETTGGQNRESSSAHADIPHRERAGRQTPHPVSDVTELKPLYQSRPWQFFSLWLLAALTYGAGDILTTAEAVLGRPGFQEANPVVAVLLEQFGMNGLIAVKAIIFGVLLVISVRGGINRDQMSFYGPPIFTILLGVGLTGWNLVGLLGA